VRYQACATSITTRAVEPGPESVKTRNGSRARTPSPSPVYPSKPPAEATSRKVRNPLTFATSPVRAGTVGRAAAYEIYASGSLLSQGTLGEALFRVTVPAVVAAGDLERRDVSGLPRWMHLWIGIRARNAFDVWSPLSNLVEVQTVNGFVGGGFALELASNPARAPVRFRFSLGSESSGNLALHDVTGRRVRELPLGSEASGFVAWNADDSNGRRLPAGLYFAVLSTPSRRTVTRVVLLP